jgi:hypothetical protein
MRGVQLKAIQELLGHSSIITTMIYAHLAPHVGRDAVRLLDQRSPAVPPNGAPASAAPTSGTPASGAPRSAEIAPQFPSEPSSAPVIPAGLAKDRRNPADGALTN